MHISFQMLTLWGFLDEKTATFVLPGIFRVCLFIPGPSLWGAASSRIPSEGPVGRFACLPPPPEAGWSGMGRGTAKDTPPVQDEFF